MKTLIPRCPSCNNALEQSVQVCEYCDSPVVITSFSTLGGMSAPKVNKYANAYKDMISENPDSEILAISLGMCFMRLKLYDKAYEAFDKAISAYTENPEVYFMAAVCALGGKKAFLAGKANVDKAISMLNNHLIHFIGSDCHNLTSRPPKMDAAISYIKRKAGNEAVFELKTFAERFL